MLKYKAIEIFTSEEARWEGKPLSDAVVEFVCRSKIAARCMVNRGTDGCYENGEIATRKLEVLSYNMPVRMTIILPEPDLERILPDLEKMVTDGIVAVQNLDVVSHKTRNRFIPRQIRVQTVMTENPKSVSPSTPVSDVVRLLLSVDFTGVPVVDETNRPVGVISQGDLIKRAGMPLRLCLLAESDKERVASFLDAAASRKASEIMSEPAVTIGENQLLTEAVGLMLDKRVKRLPVINEKGELTGILSRMDIFRTITRESPDWQAFRARNIQVENLRTVSDIMRRDTHTVHPDTPIEEIIRIIHSNDIRRVAVVDDQGRYLGIISDESLLASFSDHQAGLWDHIVSKMSFTEMGRKHKEFLDQLNARTAGDVMDTTHMTVLESIPIEEAIGLMTRHDLKRLPVLDPQGRFKGMVSRESLLRTGYAQCRI